MPPIVFALFLLQVPPFRNSDLGPHSGHSSPLPRYGVCLQVLCQEEFSSSFPSVTRVELCIHTLGAFLKPIFCARKKGPLGGARTREIGLLSSNEVKPLLTN